jgi:hypothetical protein
MTSIDDLVALAETSRHGDTEIRQSFVALLWKRSPSDLEKLAVRFAAMKMPNLHNVCRVIASMKQADYAGAPKDAGLR